MNAVMPIYDFQHLFFRLGNFRVQHLFYTVHASLDGKTSDRTAILALVGCHQLLTLFYKHFCEERRTADVKRFTVLSYDI